MAVVWSSLSGYWAKKRYSSNRFRSMHENTSCKNKPNAWNNAYLLLLGSWQEDKLFLCALKGYYPRNWNEYRNSSCLWVWLNKSVLKLYEYSFQTIQFGRETKNYSKWYITNELLTTADGWINSHSLSDLPSLWSSWAVREPPRQTWPPSCYYRCCCIFFGNTSWLHLQHLWRIVERLAAWGTCCSFRLAAMLLRTKQKI